MALVVPLKTLRPRNDKASAVAACPYDVVSVEEARQLALGNPLNFLHVEKSEIDVPPGTPNDSPLVYETARANLQRLVEDGIMVLDAGPRFHVYRQRMGGHTQYGIVAGISIAEYEADRIRRHEFTRPDKEEERTRHVDVVGAQTGPVFVTYRAREAVDRIVAQAVASPPEVDFISPDGVAHSAWTIDGDGPIGALTEAFAGVDTLYIADGHHRAAAASAAGRLRRERNPRHRGDEPYNFILAVLIPHDQIQIMAYNRAVRDLHGRDPRGFLEGVGQAFDVIPDFAEKAPLRGREFGMFLEGRWYRLVTKAGVPGVPDAVSALDVSILQDHLLKPVLGITDPRTDQRIEFVGGIRGTAELERLVKAGSFAVAFSLFPTTLTQLMAVADTGSVMPPKSTWFEPKLASGLFVHPLT